MPPPSIKLQSIPVYQLAMLAVIFSILLATSNAAAAVSAGDPSIQGGLGGGGGGGGVGGGGGGGDEQQSSIPSPSAAAGTRTMLRIYDECARSDGGLMPCLKKKAISFIDRMAHIDAITVADGVRLVRVQPPAIGPLAGNSNSNELEAAASRSAVAEDRDSKLSNLLIERLSRFFNEHSLQVSFPKMSSDEIGRGLEEGRGKMKKMMGMMMMGMAMKMMGMIPLAMGALYILAGKALIISKIALLLAGIMGLKKLMSGRGGGGGGGSSGWSSGGGGGGGGGWSSGGGGGSGGGWDRRSLNDGAHDLAYRGQNGGEFNASAKLAQQQIPLQQQHQQQQHHEQLQLQQVQKS